MPKEFLDEFLENYRYNGTDKYSENSKATIKYTLGILFTKYNVNTIEDLTIDTYNMLLEKLKDREVYSDNTATSTWHRLNFVFNYFNNFNNFNNSKKPFKVQTPPQRIPQEKIKRRLASELREKISNIQGDPKAKLFLTLLTNQDGYSVRCDWANVIIQNVIIQNVIIQKEQKEQKKATYDPDTGHFNFLILNKTGNSMEFTVNEPTRELIREVTREPTSNSANPGQQYLFDSSAKESLRSSQFSKYVKRVSKKWLGEELNVGYFRKIICNEANKKTIEQGGDVIGNLLRESRTKRDHTLETEYFDYLEDFKPQTQPTIKYLDIIRQLSLSAELKGHSLSDEVLYYVPESVYNKVPGLMEEIKEFCTVHF